MQSEGQHIGRYTIIRLLSSGGMGKVYLAKDSLVDREVAIKVIREEMGPQAGSFTANDAARLFLREAKAIARLNHPHILPLFDFGEDHLDSARRIFMVMPYCEEGSLYDWLQQRTNNLPTPQEVAYMVDQAADALQYAHDQQIIHQDIKPHNFLIRKNRHMQVPDLLLTDFGIAKVTTVNPDMSIAIRGTPAYMAPEQWEGHPVPATDQYALAATAYQMLTGRQIFQGGQGSVMYQHMMVPPQPPSSINPHLTTAIDAVILRALAKKPAERFPSVAAFSQAFKEATQQLEPHVPVNAGSNTNSGPELTLPVRYTTPSLPSNLVPPAQQEPVYLAERGPAYNAVATSLPTFQDSYRHTPPVLIPPPARRGPGTGMIILIVLLVLLLIGTSTWLATTIISNHNHDANATATSTANAATNTASNATNTAGGATSTAQANATATAQGSAAGQATATAQAQASAIVSTTDPYPPHTGALVLDDPLQDNNKGYQWNTYSDNLSACIFKSDGFHVLETKSGYFANCFAQNVDYSNFTYQVDMTILQGNCGGIMFRSDSTHMKYYYFRVCQDGTYALYRYVDNTAANAQLLVRGSNTAINTGMNQHNLLAVVASGSAISLYANQRLVNSATDSASYTHGQIAVVASNLKDTTEVVFKNAKVWQQ